MGQLLFRVYDDTSTSPVTAAGFVAAEKYLHIDMLNGYLLAPAFDTNMLSRMMLHIADGVTHDSEFISTTNDLLWALMLLAHRKRTARSAWIKLAIIEVPPAGSLPPLHMLRPQD